MSRRLFRHSPKRRFSPILGFKRSIFNTLTGLDESTSMTSIIIYRNTEPAINNVMPIIETVTLKKQWRRSSLKLDPTGTRVSLFYLKAALETMVRRKPALVIA